MYKAFQGANGWYVAWENSEGFHHQGNGNLSEREAHKLAREKNNDR